MEINKKTRMYQAGGYMTYQPLPMIPEQQQQPVPADAGATGKPAEEDNYLDKTILNKMIGDGITTDVMAYSTKLQSAYQEYNTMNEFQRNSYRGKQLRGILKGDLGELNALVRGKTTFDNAINVAKSNGALEEYAVSAQGMVVKDLSDGKVTQVSFSDFAADNNSKSKKYQALTNAQLAEEREYNKQLLGNTGVYSILNYGKGVEKVKEEVMKVAQSLGSTKSSVTNSAYERNDAEDIQQLVAAAKQGVFKVKSGQSAETNTPQIEAAKMAMWTNLSENSRAVLRARAATMVTSPTQIDKLAQTMAASLLDPLTSTSSSKIYDESVRPGAKGSGAGGEKMANMGATEMAFHGANDATPISQIGDFGVKIDGMAYALPPQLYTDNENKRLPLSNSGKLNQVGYISKAFTADGAPIATSYAMITGDAYYAKLPVKIDDKGGMKIDEEGAKSWAQFEDEWNHLPKSQQTPMKESELKQKYNVQAMNVQRLIVAEAASFDQKYGIFSDRNDKYYKKLDDATEKLLEQTVDPDAKGPARGINFAAHKHLIFIPAKNEASARFADGNSARVADSVYNVANGFNSHSDNNTQYGQGNQGIPANLTSGYFQTK